MHAHTHKTHTQTHIYTHYYIMKIVRDIGQFFEMFLKQPHNTKRPAGPKIVPVL